MHLTVLFVVYIMSLGKELDNMTYIMNRYAIVLNVTICTVYEVHFFLYLTIYPLSSQRKKMVFVENSINRHLLDESGNLYKLIVF